MTRAPTRGELAESRVLVLGLGRAGLAMAGFLLGLGTQVFAYDDNAAVFRSPGARRLRERGMRFTRKPERLEVDWVVVSPGIEDQNQALKRLRKAGAEVVDELDLSSTLVRGGLVGVTGTNGKSTTVALVGQMLKRTGKRVFVGGNIAPGRPLASGLRGRFDWYVVEASSFQLERARWFAPDVAVVLNITADHLDRHLTRARYAEAKFRILDRQSESQFAVLNRDDPVVMKAKERGRGERVLFSMRYKLRRGALLNRRGLWFRGREVAPANLLRIPGRHNIQNALAAVCAAKLAGASDRAVRRTLAEFRGLEHRLEAVRELGGVTWVNNSMCTNPAAGVHSLRAFGRKVVLITGGSEKGLAFGEYAEEVTRRAKWTVLMGSSGPKLARRLERLGYSRFEVAGELGRAVRAANARAKPGDIVLFSPAFASFDQFRDFQDRGEAFRREVRSLG
ncbi:MAG: UDP-N-acetylmuramoyl-L-alanine--D-glutamate ligase [candidate division WOR-3 bacterium]|nr:MAG: UDP-N-acetylmuramoyl-L-alanine--D-glutamate ligase [candidate division WOR-3 bacterium]